MTNQFVDIDALGHWFQKDRASIKFARELELPLRLKVLRWLGRQTWIPRGQDRLLRALYSPVTGDHYFFEVDFFGQKYRGDLAHYIDWLVFCYGAAAYPELTVLRDVASEIRRTRSGPINFFDVGANVGHHTLFMASIVDNVVAFEPLSPLRDLIDEKITINNLGNVQVIPFALGQKDETLDYFAGRGRNSGVGTFVPARSDGNDRSIKLAIKIGDNLFEEMKLPRIDIMKVDVEGFEPFVFRGLGRTIQRDRPIILTELTDSSREGFGSEAEFRRCFYAGARFAEVTGREGCEFTLKPFIYERGVDVLAEVLIVPPETADFVQRRMK